MPGDELAAMPALISKGRTFGIAAREQSRITAIPWKLDLLVEVLRWVVILRLACSIIRMAMSGTGEKLNTVLKISTNVLRALRPGRTSSSRWTSIAEGACRVCWGEH